MIVRIAKLIIFEGVKKIFFLLQLFGSEHHQHHCLNHHHHLHYYRFLLVAEIAYTAIAFCGPVELVDLLDVESGTQEAIKWTRKHLFCQKQ